ncbi:hypothetical protein L0244_32630 [bacterium]|nr:hypothetical protein [bacterium]
MRYKILLILVLLPTLAYAISVDRTVLVPRQPGIFTANVRAALNSRTTNTLVIWEKHPGNHPGHSIWGIMLSRSGTPAGTAFQIVAGPNTYFPDVVYNPDTDQFLLVYSNETSPNGRFEVQAQTLGANGDRIGSPIRVSISTDAQKSVANYTQGVVYDRETKGYVVLWWRYKFGEASGVEEGLYGSVLNSNLTIRKPAVKMFPFLRNGTQVAGPYVTDVTIHSPSKKVLIGGYTISSQPGFFVQYFVAKADPTLEKPQIVLTKLKNELSSGAAPHVDLMLLQEEQMAAHFVEGNGLKIRKINPNGAPIGPVTFFLNDPARNIPVEFPDSAFSSRDGRTEIATVALDDSITMTGRLFLQISNAQGVPNGQAIEIQSGFDGTHPPVIVPLLETPQNGFLYGVIYVEGMQLNVPPGPTESSGLVLLRVNTAP